jgi:8-oxo-dGTP pyrophosphatase MutT (NUDIX family)
MSIDDGSGDDGLLGRASPDFQPTRYALAAVVYAERDGQILLLKRAGGALSGQWFLPGGAVEAGELPRTRPGELIEESGLDIDGALELVARTRSGSTAATACSSRIAGRSSTVTSS